ncbi:alpha/beta hydrolase [Dactylosporangium sp. NPDC051485]|uniref:alpha/beta fold hydrolase n=1 Tax=Dactylosporangium sp. NPDC051485 TaxID=3154846 RepID=UPI003446E7DB
MSDGHILYGEHMSVTDHPAATDPTSSVGAQSRTVMVGDIKTHYHEAGSGAPVLLLHGSGPGVSAWANWKRTIDPIGQEYRVLAPDILGFGYTSRPEGTVYGPASWLAHVIGFLDALGIEKTHIIGNSLGARIALGVALEHPQRLDKLILMGSGALRTGTTPALAVTRNYQPTLEEMGTVLRGFAYDPSVVTDELVEERYRASVEPGAFEAYRQMFHDAAHSGSDTKLDAADLADVRAKTLIVHGYDDKIIPYEVSVRTLSAIDDAQLHIFRKCGHWAQLEFADEFNTLARRFFRRTDHESDAGKA